MSIAKPPPTLRLQVDTDALASNWRALDHLSGPAQAGAAIKANCYGLGVETCVPVLRDQGCRNFFVAHWSEVEAVAQHIPAEQIAVLHGPITDADCQYAKASGARPVINSLDQARLWNASGGGECHLMIDTGINRLGISADEIGDPAIQDLQIDVALSHLASADEDTVLNAAQLTRFKTALEHLKYNSASLANSAGIALGVDYAFDVTRPGLALYGGIPRAEFGQAIKSVVSLQAAVLQTRMIEPGDGVGYNSQFIAEREMKVATVSIGYADGYLRSWGGVGELEFDGHALPLLGKVSMDMVVVDCTSVPEIRQSDWLNIPYSLKNAAHKNGLSQYELLTILGQRFGS